MRPFLRITGILLIVLCTPLSAIAQSIYKVVDKDGNVTYTDTPPSDGAVPEELPEIIFTPPVQPKVRLSPSNSGTPEASYTAPSVTIISPVHQETIPPGAQQFVVAGRLNRPFEQEESAQLFVNGEPFGPRSSGLSWSVGDLIRGEYNIQIQVFRSNKLIASSRQLTIFVRRAIAR